MIYAQNKPLLASREKIISSIIRLPEVLIISSIQKNKTEEAGSETLKENHHIIQRGSPFSN
jgi:hypothetical protein